MQRRAFMKFTGVLAVLALSGCAGQPAQVKAESGVRFSDAEKRLIIDFYAQQGARVAGRQVQAQRARVGEKMDSGQRPTRLPDDLNKLLSYLPNPYTRLILGSDVILVNRDTHDILDVIPQVAY